MKFAPPARIAGSGVFGTPRPSLVVVDSLASANRLVRNRHETDNRVIVSLHPGIQTYLQTHGVECRDLSGFIDDDTFCANLQAAERAIAGLLSPLDEEHAAALSECLDLRPGIDWFGPLYRLHGKYDLAGLLNGQRAFQLACELVDPSEIVLYGSHAWSCISPEGDLPLVIEGALHGRPDLTGAIRCTSGEPKTTDLPVNFVGRLKRRALAAAGVVPEALNVFAWRGKKPVTVLLEPLYDLAFLKRELPAALNWAYQRDPWVLRRLSMHERGRVERAKALVQEWDPGGWDLSAFMPRHAGAAMVAAAKVLARRIQVDFSRRIERYARSLLRMRRVVTTTGVRRAVWGNDPVCGSKALIVEYLLKAGIPVIGCQHGAVYGIQVCDEHNETAHSRCSVFLSYGYTRRDLEETSTNVEAARADIRPVGSYRVFKASRARRLAGRTVDLFYPMTNNYSVLCSSQRSKVDTFVALQRELLGILDQPVGRRIVVKLSPPSVDAPSALGDVLARYAHLATTAEGILPYMRRGNVRAVLIDANFSTCLIEVIPFDCEIFVLHEPLMPFGARALSMLVDRVHYLHSAAEFGLVFEAYLEGELAPRRDPRFMNQFVFANNQDVKARIRQVIDAV